MVSTYFFTKEGGLKKNLTRAEMFNAVHKGGGTLWVDLDEPTEIEDELLAEIFAFHELAIEDCLNDACGSKMDDYGDYLFINMDTLTLKLNEEKERELINGEVSIFVGKNYVVTYHKQIVSSILADRLAVEKKPQVHLGEGAGALLHTILDHLVDSYIPVVHQYEEKVDEIETDIFDDGADYLPKLMRVKQDIFKLRRIFGPQRDMLYALSRYRLLVDKENELYFRDVYDHLSHVHLMTDTLYENLASILQVYFSYSSTKLNDVIKRLTILATLTMPAIIIPTLYGMNFEWMPFLHHEHGFWIVTAATVVATIFMLIWMKLKKWI